MKYVKNFNSYHSHIRESLDQDKSLPKIGVNNGACSIHLNFDIKKKFELGGQTFIYPSSEYTTTEKNKSMLENFASHVISRSSGDNPEKLFKNSELVSCHGAYPIREIPKEIWNNAQFVLHPEFSSDHYPDRNRNYLTKKQFELTKPIEEIEDGKIYAVFKCFTGSESTAEDGEDMTMTETGDFRKKSIFIGVIDVTQGVNKFCKDSQG
jgi:tRNA A22 N-methylase